MRRTMWKNILFLATAVLLLVGFSGNSYAKSLYLASHDDEIRAYDIAGDGYTLTYQYSGTPNEHDPVGVALDGEHAVPILFITFENGNYVQIMDATTMASLGTVIAPGSSNLAGIIYDQDNDRMYCVDRGQSNLYVYDWDYDTATLTAVSGSPFTICSGTYGIALDQTNNKLYVATNSTTIYVYDLNADGNPFSISSAGTITTTYTAISVAVDEGNQYLYYGAGFRSNDYLSQYDIITPGHTHYYIASREGVMGLGVDQGNHNVYISTGYSGDNLRVFDSSLILLSTMASGVTRPTGLVIPRAQISYNPLNLTKDDGDGSTETKVVHPGEQYTYTLTCENGNPAQVTGVTITDTLPSELDYVSCTGSGSWDGSTVTWNVGTLAASDGTPGSGSDYFSATLTVQVKSSTSTGITITNSATIDSNNTPPTTVSEPTDVTERIIAAIPTISEWGMIIFSLLLAGTAIFVLRRRLHTA